MHDLVQRQAWTALSLRQVGGRIAEGNAQAADVFVGKSQLAADELFVPKADWTAQQALRVGDNHHILRRAADVVVPQSIPTQDIQRGFAQYRDSCVYCHGAPGVDATDWAQALQPEPPFLADAVPARQPAELFWIIRNGIKMTAMPAFGRHLNDRDIWGVVGFIRQLPGMSNEAYARLVEEADRAASSQGGTPPPPGRPSN